MPTSTIQKHNNYKLYHLDQAHKKYIMASSWNRLHQLYYILWGKKSTSQHGSQLTRFDLSGSDKQTVSCQIDLGRRIVLKATAWALHPDSSDISSCWRLCTKPWQNIWNQRYKLSGFPLYIYHVLFLVEIQFLHLREGTCFISEWDAINTLISI